MADWRAFLAEVVAELRARTPYALCAAVGSALAIALLVCTITGRW